jgi:serine/threonine protein kinase
VTEVPERRLTIVPPGRPTPAAGIETGKTLRSGDDGDRIEPGALASGTLVDRYEIEGRLGGGSMGIVYAARDTRLGRRVAIKLLRPAVESNGLVFRELCQRLIREARAMASLSHPNLVSVHDIGTYAGRDFIVMDFVDGWTLRDWTERDDRSWQERFDVLIDAGRGLAEAHAAGVIHRDFKPDNVLVSRTGRSQVSDFGLARGVAGLPAIARSANGRPLADVADHITQLGVAIGTPLYMAPEIHRGEVADARSDQFAFAVTSWEILYCAHPFPGRTIAELRDAVHSADILDPPHPPTAPIDFARVLRRGLAPRRDERWPEMSDFLAELERVASRRRRAGLAGIFRRSVIRRHDR